MSEYINKGDLLKDIEDTVLFSGRPGHISAEARGARKVVERIRSAPVADVVEVRHERWKKDWCDNNLLGHEYEVCTGCGCSMIDTNQFWNSLYCPFCGAKMDGKGDGE